MANTNGYRSSRRRSRLMSFLVVLALNLTIVATALAAELVNGEFGAATATSNACNTDGWTTTGTVGANTEDAYGLIAGSYDCVARVHASTASSLSSSLAQSATVTKTHLSFLLDARTYLGGEGSQTITIYNSRGLVIYSKSNNYNDQRYFCLDLSDYSERTIKLEIKTEITGDIRMLRSSTLYVDKVAFNPGCIRPNGVGGW